VENKKIGQTRKNVKKDKKRKPKPTQKTVDGLRLRASDFMFYGMMIVSVRVPPLGAAACLRVFVLLLGFLLAFLLPSCSLLLFCCVLVCVCVCVCVRVCVRVCVCVCVCVCVVPQNLCGVCVWGGEGKGGVRCVCVASSSTLFPSSRRVLLIAPRRSLSSSPQCMSMPRTHTHTHIHCWIVFHDAITEVAVGL